MVSKRFSNLPMNYSSLLFRHLDRTSYVLAKGLDISGNVHLLSAYYALIQHYEGLLTPHLDAQYIRQAEDIRRNMPRINLTWGNLQANMVFLNGCNKWFKLLIALSYKKGLLYVAPGSWEEESPAMELSEGEESAKPNIAPGD